MNHLEGFAELDKQLEALGDPKETGKVLRSGAGAALRQVAKQARATVPKGNRAHKTYKGRLVAPGFASRSIRVVTKLSKDKQKVTALLGVRKEAFYALQFIELGTALISANPWLVPLFESSQNATIRKLGEGMRKRIDKIAAQRAAKASSA